MYRDFKTILWALALVLPLAAPLAAQEGTQPRTLTVSAQGTASVAPDIAVVELGIDERRDTAAEALDAMSQAAEGVFARLAQAGIAPEHIQTSQLTMTPFYTNSSISSGSRVQGFEASTRLIVRVENLALVGEVLDAVVQDGANRLVGIRFGIANPEPHLNTARTEAVLQARAKAELFAQAAGVTLGPLMSFAEQGSSGPEPLMMMEMADVGASRSVPIAEGEVTLRADVYLIYAIE